MPEQLLDQLDEFIDGHGYTGRSEALREGARELLAEGRGDRASGGTCVVTATFDHDADTEYALSQIRHQHGEVVTANVHSHASDCCLELFVVDGEKRDVGSFLACIRAVEGVKHVGCMPLQTTAGAKREQPLHHR